MAQEEDIIEVETEEEAEEWARDWAMEGIEYWAEPIDEEEEEENNEL
jgi:hypothetical protein